MQLKTLAVPFVAVNAVATLAQLFLGADLVVLVTLALISFSGLVPILNNRPQLSDFLFIAFTLYYGCLGLILKTLLLQPVDSNLYEPTLSSLYLLAGFGSMFMGYIALRMFTRSTEGGWGQFDSWFRNEDFLRTWVRPAFALGLLSMALSALFRTQLAPGSAVVVEEGFGGFSTFNFLVECSIAGQLYLSTRPRRPRADAIEAAVMGSAIFVLAILGNIKQPLVVLMIVICVTLLTTTGFKVKVSRLIYLGIAASMFVFFINPLIHISRDQLYGKSVVARLSLAVEILQRAQFDPWTLADQASEVLRRHSFTPSATYFYPSTANLDRFAMIMPVDQVVRALPRVGTMGLIAPNFDVAQIILPSIFIEKRPEASPDVIAWFYGFRAPGVVSRPVVGLVASAIATGGLLGALIIPGLAVFASLALLNKLAGTMRDNPWGVFLLSEAVYLSEKELAPFLAFHVRPLWIILAVVAGMCWLFSETRPKSRPRLADSRFPAPRIGP